MKHHRLTLELQATPEAAPMLADARTPPYRALGDYAAMQALLRHDSPVPVRLGYVQFYGVLERLAQAHAALGLDSPLLLEVTRPLSVPLPPALLAETVLILDDLRAEFDFWRRHARRGVLAVRCRLRREALEYGDNTLRCELASHVHETNPLPALAATLGRPGAWAWADPAGPVISTTTTEPRAACALAS